MEEKKVILLDDERRFEVKAALVLHKSSDGQYLCTYHKKEDYPTTVGSEFRQGWDLYKPTEFQGRILFTKNTDSYFFRHTLNKVLTKGQIVPHLIGLNEKEKSRVYDLLEKDFELAKSEVEKRDAYLDEKRQQKIKEQEDTEKKATDALSKKIADYLDKFTGR